MLWFDWNENHFLQLKISSGEDNSKYKEIRTLILAKLQNLQQFDNIAVSQKEIEEARDIHYLALESDRANKLAEEEKRLKTENSDKKSALLEVIHFRIVLPISAKFHQ